MSRKVEDTKTRRVLHCWLLPSSSTVNGSPGERGEVEAGRPSLASIVSTLRRGGEGYVTLTISFVPIISKQVSSYLASWPPAPRLTSSWSTESEKPDISRLFSSFLPSSSQLSGLAS